jgi:hypothetical protein
VSVERLRGLLAKRGVGVGAGSVAALLSTHAVQAAPLGLVASVSAAAAVAGTASATFTAVASTIAMTTLQKVAVSLVVAAAAGQNSARSTTDRNRKNFDLSDAQADQFYGSLYQLALDDQTAHTPKPDELVGPTTQVSALRGTAINAETGRAFRFRGRRQAREMPGRKVDRNRPDCRYAKGVGAAEFRGG